MKLSPWLLAAQCPWCRAKCFPLQHQQNLWTSQSCLSWDWPFTDYFYRILLIWIVYLGTLLLTPLKTLGFLLNCLLSCPANTICSSLKQAFVDLSGKSESVWSILWGLLLCKRFWPLFFDLVLAIYEDLECHPDCQRVPRPGTFSFPVWVEFLFQSDLLSSFGLRKTVRLSVMSPMTVVDCW